MSVFRCGSVGPNFQPNLLLEPPHGGGKKGEMVKIPLLLDEGDVRRRRPLAWFCLLVDCRTQQTFRVFLTRIFNIISSKPILGCDRVLA